MARRWPIDALTADVIRSSGLSGFLRAAVVACLLSAGALACAGGPQPVPSVPPLTAPAPATAAPTPTEAAQAEPDRPTPTNPPAASPAVEATAAPTQQPTPVPAPTPDAGDASSDVAARLTGLIEGLLEPREVDADTVWASFIIQRTAPLAGFDPAAAAEIQAKMLQMWHADNACYAELQDAIARLEPGARLSLVDYPHFLDYAQREVSPCIEKQLVIMDGADFFAETTEVRTVRITVWFESGWQDGSGQLGRLAATCRDSFYSYLPEAVAATDPEQLATAWNTALSGQSQCLLSAMHQDLRFLIDPSTLFELPEADLPEMITLHTTIAGHALALGMGRNYDECWPAFEARLPDVAAAQTFDELSLIQDDALESLAVCVQLLPPTNPFAGW